jgi:hypothetical protein
MDKRVQEVTSSLLAQYTPLRLALALGIHHTHVYRARAGSYANLRAKSARCRALATTA